MATVDQYRLGLVAKMVRQAYDIMQSMEGSVAESEFGRRWQKQVTELAPMRLNQAQAERFIDDAERCAVGERACLSAFEDAPCTRSVFLDDLADGLVEAGKAEYVSKEKAKEVLAEYRNPIVISKVSGKYMEICRTWPKNCLYWNLEKRGLKCLAKP